MNAEKLLNDMKRLDKVRRYNRRGPFNKKEHLKKRRGHRCDYCKQKSKDLNVRLERYHVVKENEDIQKIADKYNTSTKRLLVINQTILSERKWRKGLMLNVPGNLNIYMGKNGVVSCKSCSYERRTKGLTHPEFVYFLVDKRKAVRDEVTEEFREMIYTRDQHKCHYCELIGQKTKGKLTLDHLIPVVDGGETNEKNVVTACWDHNRDKGTMPYGVFVDKLLKEQVASV